MTTKMLGMKEDAKPSVLVVVENINVTGERLLS
jgi:hypothetical protein